MRDHLQGLVPYTCPVTTGNSSHVLWRGIAWTDRFISTCKQFATVEDLEPEKAELLCLARDWRAAVFTTQRPVGGSDNWEAFLKNIKALASDPLSINNLFTILGPDKFNIDLLGSAKLHVRQGVIPPEELHVTVNDVDRLAHTKAAGGSKRGRETHESATHSPLRPKRPRPNVTEDSPSTHTCPLFDSN